MSRIGTSGLGRMTRTSGNRDVEKWGPREAVACLICKTNRREHRIRSPWPTGGVTAVKSARGALEVLQPPDRQRGPQPRSPEARGRSGVGATLDSRSRGGRRAQRLVPAPRAAAERSGRNLLTGPEQRAANPAGGRGRAGGRRDPAPSPRRAAADLTPRSSPRPAGPGAGAEAGGGVRGRRGAPLPRALCAGAAANC